MCRERPKDFLDAREGGALRDRAASAATRGEAAVAARKRARDRHRKAETRSGLGEPARRVGPGRTAARPHGKTGNEAGGVSVCATAEVVKVG